MNPDDLVAQLGTAIELQLNRTDWPHRPGCQMLRNPPKGLFDGFSCNCDAATMWMLIHEAARKILDLHKPIPPVDYPGRDDVVFSTKIVCANCGPTGNDPQIYIFETSENPAIWYPCPTVLALVGAYGIRP